jgi:predicted transcriptional regulator
MSATQLVSDLPKNTPKGKRGMLDIANLILEICIDGEIKTHVMYRCNLNSKQTQDYVALLQKHQLLEKSSVLKNDIYRTTEQGKRFVGAYGELAEIFDFLTLNTSYTRSQTALEPASQTIG